MNYYHILNEHGNAWIMTNSSSCVIVQQPFDHPPSIIKYEKPYSRQNGDVVNDSNYVDFQSKAKEVFIELTGRKS